ncbi:hypothetical protein SEPCBS119000_006796, partial [Sporothrix epigloea]
MDVEMTVANDEPQPKATAAVTTTPATEATATTGNANNAATPPVRSAPVKAAAPQPTPRTAATTSPKTPAKKSWAGVARSVAKPAAAVTVAATQEAGWTVVTGKNTAAAVVDGDDKILVLKGAKTMPSPRLLRDTINGRGVMHVVGARLSAKGNAVLTCASAASRQYLQSTQHVWLPRLSPMGWKSVATKETWIRLIAHGVAVADMPQFSAEFYASNGVETR